MASILPPKAHAAAGQLEDALTTWRNGTRPHARTRAAGERAVALCGDIIVEFQKLRDQLTTELGQYDDAQRKGT
ncbi:hypothetical protein G1H11_14040 [Phytoactinopolyspora alkaliphila]|uniref:Uncharacterized protein n=1 Tax=Phytoactinopolyspora alkaliphila TaxID=1783498 RepID=A0A6N9YN05_9ACTN|nr:hypothetical protein [Phytoactinopolyspora alkaliphila]NED96426.1 hypothetical protein [Phytoactinopolyspora alkaliphila]